MKILIAFALLAGLLPAPCGAQNYSQPVAGRTISVTGTAEQEMVPDEIYVQIELKEYDIKGQGKKGLEAIRSDFLKRAKSSGVPDSAITIASYDGLNGSDWWRRKKQKEVLYSSITYELKMRSSQQLHDLVDRLDERATESFNIIRVAYSGTTALRRQLKIDALRAARDKARYLAEAVGEQIGEAITITEDADSGTSFWTPQANMMANTVLNPGGTDSENGAGNDFRKIRLKFSVSVVYALK